MKEGGRGGYEYFPEDGNYLFTMTQWYPRLCVYSDFQGWQNHQFTGRGEFALTFGNFKVQMTVPADHVVGATGECQNYQQVLDATHYARWQKAQTATTPLRNCNAGRSNSSRKTKKHRHQNLDFHGRNGARFCLDMLRANLYGMQCRRMVEGKKVMCMSFYGKEAYGLYSKYSTKAGGAYHSYLFALYHSLSLPGGTKRRSCQWYGIPDDLL